VAPRDGSRPDANGRYAALLEIHARARQLAHHSREVWFVADHEQVRVMSPALQKRYRVGAVESLRERLENLWLDRARENVSGKSCRVQRS
jgi:hypothetical protein